MTPLAAEPTDLLAYLRRVTAADHQGLENWINIDQRFSTSAGYQDYLSKLLPLFRGFENSLSLLPWSENGLDFDSRRKVGFIERDLRFLGLPVDTGSEIPFPAPPTLAAGFGCLYVLEGSTLGGRVIVERLQSRRVYPDSGAAFFYCYGDLTSSLWKAFKEKASEYCSTEARQQEAGAAAIATFDHYRKNIPPLQ